MSNYHRTSAHGRTTLGPRGQNVLYAPMGLGATDLGLDPAAGSIGAQAVRIDRDWHPTGYYTPKDVIGIVGQLGLVYAKVRAPLARFAADMNVNTLLRNFLGTRATTELVKVDQAQARAQSYATISVNAAAQGMKYMDAPGLKSLVVGHLKRMSLAVSNLRGMVDELQAASVSKYGPLGPIIDPLVNIAASFAESIIPVVTSAANTIMKVAGVAYDVVKAVGNAVMKIPDTIGTIFTLLKWGVIIGGGLWIYREAKDARLIGAAA